MLAAGTVLDNIKIYLVISREIFPLEKARSHFCSYQLQVLVSELRWVGDAEKAAGFMTFLLGCLLSLPSNPVQCRMLFLHRFLTQPSGNKNRPRKIVQNKQQCLEY